MSHDLMNYEQMRSLALRGVVRDAIRRVIREDGLPGAHHFYITFLTRFPGAEIDEHLAAKYPEEITIVLEHQFWDLAANDDDFEVTLKFGGIPKYLRVPYLAVTRFHDPSVGFSLMFDTPPEFTSGPVLGLATAPNSLSGGLPVSGLTGSSSGLSSTDVGEPVSDKTAELLAAETKGAEAEDSDDDTPPGDDDGPKVVSLDAFRKK